MPWRKQSAKSSFFLWELNFSTHSGNCFIISKQYLTPNGESFSDTFKLNFNPNPVTTSYPDITELAKYLFKDPARWRDTGYLCRTNADQTRNLDRLGCNNPNDKIYQEINSNNKDKNNTIYYLGGHAN